MSLDFPPMTLVRGRLKELKGQQVVELAEVSGVPFATLMKIRQGTTGNPGIETVRAFWPLIEIVKNGSKTAKG